MIRRGALCALAFAFAACHCFADRTVVLHFSDATSIPVKHCFVTKHGLVVDAAPLVECPAQLTVETVTADLLHAVGDPPDWSLRGGIVVFVDFPLACHNGYWNSCTEGNLTTVRRIDGWAVSLRHEMAHQLHAALQRGNDPDHEDCDFWARVSGGYCDSFGLTSVDL